MDLSTKDIELIESYLRGELNATEVSLLEDRMGKEESFREEFIKMKAIKAGIDLNALSGVMSDMANWEIEYENTQSEDASKHNLISDVNIPTEKALDKKESDSFTIIKRYRILITSAAAIIILFGTLLWLNIGQSESEKLIEEYFEPYPSEVHFTRSSDVQDLSETKKQAYLNYEMEDYISAAPIFESLYNEEKDSTLLFLAGVSYLAQNNIKKAKAIFSSHTWDTERKQYLERMAPILNLEK